MEKIYLPVDFVFSNAGEDLYEQPDNRGNLGLPAFRDYVIDTSGSVTAVLAQVYDPSAILDAVHDALDSPPDR